jgi:dimeric dUTPase (all-alpha-NTP-PPase superfamily)
MRTLRIENGGRLIVDGELVEMSKIENKTEFVSSLLTLDVEFSDDLIISDLIHFFYDSKSIIKDILSEEYEVVRALITTINLPREYKALRIYKSFRFEKDSSDDEFVYLTPEIDLIPSLPGEDGIKNLYSMSIMIDENISLHNNENGLKIISKTKISLLDVMTCIFEDLSSLLKEGSLLY